MKHTTAVAAAAALVFAVLAGGSSARSGKSITLGLDDTVVVAGSSILCQTQIGKNLMKGKTLVACYKVRGGKPVNGSYAAAQAIDDEIALAKANASGATVVFRRKPAAVSAAVGKTYTVANGDELHLAKSNLACTVQVTAGKPYISCFRLSGMGGIPKSYTFAFGDSFAIVLQFTTPKATKLVVKRAQP